jgi:putative chitinase
MNTSNLKLASNVMLEIPSVSDKFGVNTSLRLAHFLSQCAHESGDFKFVTENLNYSAIGLRKVFGKYFPNDNIADQYTRKPEKIANKVYANRMGNGDEASGDGWKFRGRGYIQLTGKNNYSEFDKIVDDDILANPDLVATKYPLMSAAFFFNKNCLWAICDKGDSIDVVTQLTKRINGGVIGLEDRIKKFREYNALLNV